MSRRSGSSTSAGVAVGGRQVEHHEVAAVDHRALDLDVAQREARRAARDDRQPAHAADGLVRDIELGDRVPVPAR
jgi:hypothetical protein